MDKKPAMKTHKKLWPLVTDFQNLLLAAQKAQRGKRSQPNVCAYHVELERNLFALKQMLENQTYRPGKYKAFRIHAPKPRTISAAPYRDRVAHHALGNVIAPILEKSMIADTFANRKGKGTHAAADRFQHYSRIYPFVLKCA
jgi:hypothetical protein